LDIAWPLPASALILSDKDKNHPGLEDLPPYFRYAA
jgi:hypothetical protein